MLNKRQREFRKTMKAIEKKRASNHEIYSYREQRYSNEKPKQRFKKPILKISGFVGLLLLIWNLYAFSTYLTPEGSGFGIVSPDNLKVHRYLEQGLKTEVEIVMTVNSLVTQYNDRSLTPLHIEKAQRTLFELQRNFSLDNDRFTPMNRYFEEQFSVAFQLTNILLTKNESTINQEILYVIGRQTELTASREALLIQLLESEKMKYEIHEDGSVSYEY